MLLAPRLYTMSDEETWAVDASVGCLLADSCAGGRCLVAVLAVGGAWEFLRSCLLRTFETSPVYAVLRALGGSLLLGMNCCAVFDMLTCLVCEDPIRSLLWRFTCPAVPGLPVGPFYRTRS